jgi:hypothetical protein
MYVLKLLVTEFILGSGEFLLTPRQVAKLVHACLGIVGSRVHTSVGEGWF